MLIRQTLKKYGSKFASTCAAGASALAVTAGSALAAVPADVTTAVSSMKEDGITIATAFLVATIAVAAFLFMRKGARA